MTRTITIDEVKPDFPFSGVRGCHLSLDGKRVAYDYRGNITIFDIRQMARRDFF